jgi:hypothetical protein
MSERLNEYQWKKCCVHVDVDHSRNAVYCKQCRCIVAGEALLAAHRDDAPAYFVTHPEHGVAGPIVQSSRPEKGEGTLRCNYYFGGFDGGDRCQLELGHKGIHIWRADGELARPSEPAPAKREEA